MTNEGEPPVSPQIIAPPRDLYELFMMGRAEIGDGQSFQQLYLKLLSLIDVGKEMLPDNLPDLKETKRMRELRQEAVDLLANDKIYPTHREMDYDSKVGTYSMGYTEQTGRMVVRPEEVDQALNDEREQQTARLIPLLKEVDSKIFKALVDYGIIDVKKPSMEDIIGQQLVMEMQQKMAEKAERDAMKKMVEEVEKEDTNEKRKHMDGI